MAHGNAPVRGMKFVCDRSWDDMAATDHGRFCDSCQKPVIDFTGWSREELIAWFKSEPETCGMFERHQIDASYVPIADAARQWRRGFLAIFAALSLGATQAQAPAQPTPIEQSARRSGSTGNAAASQRSMSTNPKLTWDVCPAIPDPTPRRSRTRVYLSGSFPFVHIGKRRFRTMGCPAF